MERKTARVIMGAIGVLLATFGASLVSSELASIPAVSITPGLILSAMGVLLFGLAFFARASRR